MGRDLADAYPIAKQTFEEADDALEYKLSQLCFEGPEEQLRLTEITQPAILTASVAAYRVLNEKGIRPSYLAGHSLGEYSAHVAAGTISFRDAVRTVRNRGKYMQEAVPVGVGAMAAIVGMDLEAVIPICKEAAQNEICEPEHKFSGTDRDFRSCNRNRAGHKVGGCAGSEARGIAAGERAIPLCLDEAGTGPAGS